MEYGIWHVERRDGTTRDQLATAALAFCRAFRDLDGVAGCRFYWKPVDTVVIVAEADSAASWSRGSSDLARAQFDLFDVGRGVGYETWLDAKTGQDIHDAARG